MLFHEWVETSGLSRTEIAAGIGVTPAMVHSVIHGERRFSPENARKVVDLSGGKVTLEELLFPKDAQKASNE